MINKSNIRIAVGMSGGVDSTMAAFLLKQKGYKVIGLTMKIWKGNLPVDTKQTGGSNENTNMLLRRYLPKKTDISNLTQQELNDIANELNNRPRKRLGFLTPLEFYEQKVLNTKRGATIAVESRM